MAPRSHYTSTPYTIHDEVLRDDLEALHRPEVTLEQQRLLFTVMSTGISLRDEARCSSPTQFVQDVISQGASSSADRARRRPLNEAAIRQNSRARVRKTYTERLVADGYELPTTPESSPWPIRHGDTYDHLVGTLSSAHRDAIVLIGGPNLPAATHRMNEDRRLVEARQARVLAGLPTEDIDVAIAMRILRNTKDWGWSGACIVRSNAWRALAVAVLREEVAYRLMEGSQPGWRTSMPVDELDIELTVGN